MASKNAWKNRTLMIVLIIIITVLILFILRMQLHKSTKNDKYTEAIETLNYALCEKVISNESFIQDKCYYTIAMLKNDSTICSFIKTKSRYCPPASKECGTWYNKDVCYTKFAIQNNDISLCNNVQDVPQAVGYDLISAPKCREFVSREKVDGKDYFLNKAP